MKYPAIPHRLPQEFRRRNRRLRASYPTARTACPPRVFSPRAGIGTRPVQAGQQDLSFADLDGDAMLLGLVGFIDPPREEAIEGEEAQGGEEARR